MANAFEVYSLPLKQGAHGVGTLSIMDDYSCSADEDYLGNPIVIGHCYYGLDYGSSVLYFNYDIVSFTGQAQYPNALRAFFLRTWKAYTQQTSDNWVGIDSDGYTGNVQRQNMRFQRENMPNDYWTSYQAWTPPVSYNMLDVCIGTVSTNIPIFDTKEHANAYLLEGDASVRSQMIKDYAINYKSPDTVPETKEYFYYGYAHNYTIDVNGGVSENNEPVLYKGFRVKSTGRISLYVIDGISDGHLKLGINLAAVDIAYYSYDGETWQNQQSSPTTLPFDYVWRKWDREVGTFYCSGVDGKLYETNCYIFGNKEDSDDYNDGTDETGEKAINYGDVNPDAPFNPTGLEDEETTFGEVYTRAFFSQQYICSASAIQEISNAMFDITQGGITGIFEDIKKGLEMYGEGSGVINAVQSCMFYPFDLNSVFTNTQNQAYIYFGGYKFDLQNTTVNKIIYPNGYIDFGSVKLERTFNSYRDYSPYQRLYVYLPYLAWYELDINKYLGKTIGVKYFIDTRTGLCMAVLTANGVMCDYMTGQIGVAMPLTLTDYSMYASAQIRTLLGGGSNVIGSGGGMGSKITEGYKNFTGGLVEGGAVGLGVGLGVAGVGVSGAFQGAKTLYGLTQNNINNFNKTIGSGSTSMLNQYLPQEVCFLFEIQDADITPNEQMLQGYPSNASGTIGSFTGYLEVDTVNLVCADATANEKAQIVSMLKSGVYI